MKTFTDYLWFTTKQRQEFVRVTDEVAAIVTKSGVDDGMVLVSASHITAGVYVNDWEDGLIADFQVWLEKLAPAGLPYKHHQTGEDNADAHLKRTIMGHQVMVPITNGKLDLGPWEQIFYAEFDGQRRKRVVVKVMGSGRESDAGRLGCRRLTHPSDREYPARPIVGVGAVILVSPVEARAMGWAERLEGTGIVLVKRRFEPLAGPVEPAGRDARSRGNADGGHRARGRRGNRADGRRRRRSSTSSIASFSTRLLTTPTKQPRVKYHFVLIDYVCRPTGGQLRAGSDVGDVTIAAPDDLTRYALTAKTLDVIQKALASRKGTDGHAVA